jgi:hypothetical protein
VVTLRKAAFGLYCSHAARRDVGKILGPVQAQAGNSDIRASGQLERPLRNFAGKMPVVCDHSMLR